MKRFIPTVVCKFFMLFAALGAAINDLRLCSQYRSAIRGVANPMRSRTTTALLMVSMGGLLLFCPTARADSFGIGENSFEIEFVTIGDPGNLADTTGVPNPAGAVPYSYRIGKFEISEQMINKANAASAEAGDPLAITIDQRGPNKPATRVSWFEAALFVNWLNTSTGNMPAYNFDANGDFQLWQPGDAGYNPANLFRNSLTRYVLPSVDEWYKAAFYDPVTDVYFDFPNGSDTAPLPVASGTEPGTAVWNQLDSVGPSDVHLAGGLSPFGTIAQGGNVFEWLETPLDAVTSHIPEPDFRAFRGEDWGLVNSPLGLSSSAAGGNRLAIFPANSLGFRIVSVPEPRASGLLFLGGIGLLSRRRQYISR